MATSAGVKFNRPPDVSVPRLGTIVAKKILSYGIRKIEPVSPWSTLYDRAILVSLSELSIVSVDEAPQASEIFLAIYLSLTRPNRTIGSSIE